MHGTIKNLRADRGFGFLTHTDSGKSYFFHVTGCHRGLSLAHLRPGDPVAFDLEEGAKGTQATNVRLA